MRKGKGSFRKKNRHGGKKTILISRGGIRL